MIKSAMDICFVSIPFQPIERPLISFGLLQAILKKGNIKAFTLYYNLDFAKKIGVKNYHVMAQFAYFLFGEWVFSKCLFSDNVKEDDYLNKLHDLLPHSKIKPLPLFYDKDYLIKLRITAHDFLKETAEEVIKEYNPKIVACSSLFDNHIACISFLKFIKELSPQTITMIGGPNCEDEMGKTTHKLFPYVDYVVSGYADNIITDLCRKIFAYRMNMPRDEVPNQVFAPIFREKGYERTGNRIESQSNINLNELPVPDYSDYFKKLHSLSEVQGKILPAIPIESSRGCYWGKCKFCGLNRNQLNYIQKDWRKVYKEMAALTTDHEVTKVEFVDNAINYNKLSGLFEKITNSNFDLQIFAEVRVHLKKKQIKKMREAGVIWIQPGIESLSDDFLDCMKKGSSMIQNIQIMKWAQQYGISVVWSIMHSFPFEKDKWFRDLGEILPLFVHLQPPWGMTKLRFDRFSDYHQKQSEYELDLKALEIYSHIYPYDQPTLNRLAYFFEDNKASRLRKKKLLHRLLGKPERNFNRVKKIVEEWMETFYSDTPFRLIYEIIDNTIFIHDSRPISCNNDYSLNELEGEIFLFSDEAKSLEEIYTVFGNRYKKADIENAICSLSDKKVVLQHKNNLLALAVQSPIPSLPSINYLPCGTVVNDS